MAHRLSYSGRDEATGCSFDIVISPGEYPSSVDGHELHVEVQCRFPEASIPHSYQYHDMDCWGLQDPESLSTLGGLLSRWLDGDGIPLTARNDTIRLLFDSMSSVGEAVDGVLVRVGLYYPADRDPEVDEVERVVELSLQEGSLRPTPASRESVEALERVVIRGEEREESCSVCLEEFSLGLDATKMPCSHLFHGDCIVGWLEVQRFCPLCRYELLCVEDSIEFAE